jgi:hypothetical protein
LGKEFLGLNVAADLVDVYAYFSPLFAFPFFFFLIGNELLGLNVAADLVDAKVLPITPSTPTSYKVIYPVNPSTPTSYKVFCIHIHIHMYIYIYTYIPISKSAACHPLHTHILQGVIYILSKTLSEKENIVVIKFGFSVLKYGISGP